ncbi:phosphoribosylformylglycinamidine synthase subunit PurL [Aminomonas paucivorans]|uniref:phosphoribosylformylglycinamidine synthase subunit PurL n=1 Tax=Aminomonas paucivorans TaxID=81412 RepID=UPI00332238FD
MKGREVGLKEREWELLLQRLGREPNDLELQMVGVMWSEHCSYKSTRNFLKELPQKGEAVVHGPGENAGVVDLGEGWGLAFKVESHNHPSAVAPYQGAATGVGGIIRDILAMGARPVASLDGLCFGDPSTPRTAHLAPGIVEGIGGYGNAVGVPTVGGLTLHDPCYDDNPLVNAFCAGLVRLENLASSQTAVPGLAVLLLGSKTGRDGIAGAAFASRELEEDGAASRPQIQIGDPFEEKLLIEACLELLDKRLIVGMQDMGAAGILSSSSEVAFKSGVGMTIHCDRVPLREADMAPWEIFLSESQERMLLVVEPGRVQEVEALARRYGLDCAAVGQTEAGNRYRVFHRGELVADLPTSLLGGDAPLADWEARIPADLGCRQTLRLEEHPDLASVGSALEDLFRDPNMGDFTWIHEQYDSMVQLNTVLGPGSPVAALRLKNSSRRVVLSMETNPWCSHLDPRGGTAEATAACLRALWVAGARPLGLTNCLNFPSPEVPEQYWELGEAIRGMAWACEELDCPVVSGNVSLYNESASGKILPTPLLVAAGLVEDGAHLLSPRGGRPGDRIVLVGPSCSLGGSLYGRRTFGLKGKPFLFQPDLERDFRARSLEAARSGLASSGRTLAAGGLGGTLVKILLTSGLGAEVDFRSPDRKDLFFFGEGGPRALYTVPQKSLVPFLALWRGYPAEVLGGLKEERTLTLPDEAPLPLDRLAALRPGRP